jgi:hypothetical protein
MAGTTGGEKLKAAEQAARQAPGRGLPPVHLWNPPHSGEIDIVIARDGSWRHEGAPIGREALVRLFSTILRKDADGIYLVTPVEKMRITVEDAPFVAVRVDQLTGADGRPVLRFTTNVRRGLEALIGRPVFYELVDLAETRDGTLGVESHGAWFPLGPAA